jgi:polysaccharide biosynthesis protein PslE
MTGMISKVELLEIVFRHKLKIIIIPLIILMMTMGVVLFFPRKYRSEAKLYLQVGRESLGVDATATVGPTAGLVQSNRDEEIKSALQVVGSRGVISQVVKQLGPEYVLTCVEPNAEPVKKNPIMEKIKGGIGSTLSVLKSIDPVSPDEEAALEIESNLKIEAERNSMVISATYDAESPKAAQKILDTLIDVYQSEHLRIHRNRNSEQFLSDQRDFLREQYNDAQQCVKDAKNEFGISSIDGRRHSLETQLQTIELEKTQNTQNLTTSQAKGNDIRTQLASLPERERSSQKSIPNQGADLLRQELYENQIRLMDQKSRLAPNHPLLVATSKQVEDAKRLVEAQETQRQETVDDINPIYRALSLELRTQESVVASLIARQKELSVQHDEVVRAIETFNRQAIELTQLEHNEQIARDKYLQYTNSFEQSRIDRKLEEGKISSVSVAQSATLAEKPVSPSKLLVLLGGAFMSLASVVGLVFLSEKMNDRIRSESDLATLLGLPVLATIPDSPQHKRILAR